MNGPYQILHRREEEKAEKKRANLSQTRSFQVETE